MRKAVIQVDWIIAVFIFLIFIAWSYQYYAGFFARTGMPMEDVASGVSDAIMDNLTSRVAYYPVTYVSPDSTNSVMYAYHCWKSDWEKNTTMVLDGSGRVECLISGDAVYWRDDVAAGENNFTIRVSNRSGSNLNCTGSFSLDGANQTIPRAGDTKRMLSVAYAESASYEQFRAANGISRSFRLYVEVDGENIISMGPQPPNASNVFAGESWRELEETGQDARIVALVW